MQISFRDCIEQGFISQAESVLNGAKTVEEIACFYIALLLMLLRMQIYCSTKLIAWNALHSHKICWLPFVLYFISCNIIQIVVVAFIQIYRNFRVILP
jgi:hypothetical protein